MRVPDSLDFGPILRSVPVSGPSSILQHIAQLAYHPLPPSSRILYTCSVQEGLDHQTALGALDLAHRWQAEVVVAILSDLLAGG